MSIGGLGGISVLSNLMPKQTFRMCHKYFDGDVEGSRALQLEYFALVKALFSEVNPIPVKAAMAAMGFCEDCLRLPLTSMEEKNREKLFELMRKERLI